MPSLTLDARGEAEVTLARACEHLLALQDGAGFWRGELQTNVTMDAEDILLREFLGVRRDDETERSAAWIRSQQREDGTWANFYDGPGELSTTIEAYSGAAARGRRRRGAAHVRRRRVHPARGRHRARARLHARVARAVRAVVVGPGARAPARGDPAALVGAVQRVRLRVLGAPDDRGAVARQIPPPAAPAAVRARRAARARRRAAPVAAAQPARAGPSGARPCAARV